MVDKKALIDKAGLAGKALELSREPAGYDVIFRGGKEVKPPVVNNDRLSSWLDTVTTIGRKEVPRVVGQDVRPGAVVPRGTEVNLVLTEPADLPINVFERFHIDLKDVAVASVAKVFDTPGVEDIVVKYRQEGTLSDADSARVQEALRQHDLGLEVGGTGQRSVDSLMATLDGVLAFR